MRLKLTAGNHLVAALAQNAGLRVQPWLDANCAFQQHTLLSRPVLHWLTILQHHVHRHMPQLHLQHGVCLAVTLHEDQ